LRILENLMPSSWQSITLTSTLADGNSFGADMMLLLTDGSVFIHNAYSNEWLRFQPDPTTGYAGASWATQFVEADMLNTRQYFASGVLMDGRVFAIGAELSNAGNDTPLAEIFDPQTNLWTVLTKPAAFNFVLGDCNGSILADGRVLVGGATASGPPSSWSKLTALWDPSDDSWQQAGLQFGADTATTKEDPFEEESWALLPDGSVFAPAVRDTPKAERYVPSLDQWVPCAAAPVNLCLTTLNGVGVYEIGPSVLLPSGKVLAIGGTGSSAIFTPGPNPTSLGTWVQGPTTPADTSATPLTPNLTCLDIPACVLPNGKVVFLAGTTNLDSSGNYFSQNTVFFEWDPTTSPTTFAKLDLQPTLSSGNYTWQLNFLLLPTGQILCSDHTNTLLLYTPDPATSAPNPAWKPANISAPATMVLGHSYTVSGTQINGLTQAVYYGDDGGMATNYPIVQLIDSTGGIHYVRSSNFSTLGVATGASVESCTIDIPSNLTPGNWSLVVVANGIASDPVPVQIIGQDCFFIVDNSTFSIGEVDTYLHATPPVNAVFNPAFYVVVEGYTPAEIGIDTSQPILPQLQNPPNLPQVPSHFPGAMTIAFQGPMIPQDPTLPPTPQRFTFPFSITFTADSMFGTGAIPVVLNATFSAGTNVANTATITLISKPNPYILHGDQTLTPPEPWYLSQDLKVFQVVASPGATIPFGASLTTGSAEQIATTYIQAAVTNLRNNVAGTRAYFDSLAQDEDSEILQLLPNDPATGAPVYNFAIARVRLRDTQTALNVRVFFRIWQAQQTNATYNTTTYARGTNAAGQPIPVLGVQGDEIITIPFFAQARQTTSQQLHLQVDDFNRHDIASTPGETDFFFGCWLDINQINPNDFRYPQRIVGVSADGPFNTVSPLFPIQQFMVAAHQCLVAEVAFDPDPIVPPADDPSTSDKLAQRNLAFVPAPNPGNPASRRVPQTFEVKPSALKAPLGVRSDELMLDWAKLPPGSTAEVYLPAVSGAAIIARADELYTSHRLQLIDSHTLSFPAEGVTYIPLPSGLGVSFAGLLTVDLPLGITRGEKFSVVVRQIASVRAGRATSQSGAFVFDEWLRTTGTFKLTIDVSTKAQLLAPEEQYLSVMKWVAQAIHPTSRWYLIMERYLKQIAGRVQFMGGNPIDIHASGRGQGKSRHPDCEQHWHPCHHHHHDHDHH
jgi:hypothetical protein